MVQLYLDIDLLSQCPVSELRLLARVFLAGALFASVGAVLAAVVGKRRNHQTTGRAVRRSQTYIYTVSGMARDWKILSPSPRTRDSIHNTLRITVHSHSCWLTHVFMELQRLLARPTSIPHCLLTLESCLYLDRSWRCTCG